MEGKSREDHTDREHKVEGATEEGKFQTKKTGKKPNDRGKLGCKGKSEKNARLKGEEWKEQTEDRKLGVKQNKGRGQEMQRTTLEEQEVIRKHGKSNYRERSNGNHIHITTHTAGDGRHCSSSTSPLSHISSDLEVSTRQAIWMK